MDPLRAAASCIPALTRITAQQNEEEEGEGEGEEEEEEKEKEREDVS